MARKKEQRPEGIGHIINQVIKKLDTKTHGRREEVVDAWQKAVDPKAAFHTRPVAIKKKGILESMGKALGRGKIEDIRFRMGEIT